MNTDPRNTDSRKEQALDYSIKDGSYWAVMAGFGESYLSAFGVFLQASKSQISLLATLPQFFASFVQLISNDVAIFFASRKKTVIIFALLQTFCYLLILTVGYFYPNVWFLIFLASLYFVFAAIPGPVWASWMGDLVEEKKRNDYFGLRTMIISLVLLISTIIAGIILERFSDTNPLLGFTIIFTIAFVARLASTIYLSLCYEPIVEIKPSNTIPFWQFVKELQTTNFGAFSMYISLLLFGVYIGGPLLTIYYLERLHFSYMQYTILISAASLANVMTVTLWAKFANNFGNKYTLYISSIIISTLPFLWYFSSWLALPYAFYMLLVVEILAGLSWAGFNLTTANFMYDCIEPHQRISMFAYHNALRGVFILVGGILGGILSEIETVRAVLGSGILFAFLLSGFIRVIVIVLFANKFKEVKILKSAKPNITISSGQTMHSLVTSVVVGFNRTVRLIDHTVNIILKKK